VPNQRHHEEQRPDERRRTTGRMNECSRAQRLTEGVISRSRLTIARASLRCPKCAQQEARKR
jgi:hypothetical protein